MHLPRLYRVLLSKLQRQRWISSSPPSREKHTRSQSEAEHGSENPFDFRSLDSKTKAVIGAFLVGVGYYVVQLRSLEVEYDCMYGCRRREGGSSWTLEDRVSLFVTNFIAKG
jgi:hypothetical protein